MEPKKTRAQWQRCISELEMERLELQMDLEGCETRLNMARATAERAEKGHEQERNRLNAIIARQRDWIVELELRVRRLESENAELRGEGGDETV